MTDRMESAGARDRALDYPSDMEVDVLEEEEDSNCNAADHLEKADEARISRDRSMKRTSTEKANTSANAKKTRVSLGSSTQLVNISPHQRVTEFPAEYLTVSSGKLYCEVCCTVLSVKKSIVKLHITSHRHSKGKETHQQQSLHQQRLIQSWEQYQQRHSLAGTGLSQAVPTEQSVRRIETVTAFLKAGIPLAKADYLRPLLEAGAERLTFSTHLASYIPFVLEVERDRLKEELKDKPFICVIFDGSTHLGEMLVILIRFVREDFEICQRLVRVHVLAKSLNAQQLAREIITTLSTDLQYPSERVLAMVRDGASVNSAAVKILKDALYPQLADIICIPHSLDLIGRKFDTDLLDSFLQAWVALFSHSPASRLVWQNLSGESIRSYSATRWWSWWEVLAQLHRLFRHVNVFLADLQSCPSTVAKLKRVLEDPDEQTQLRLQLAITIDMGKPIVQKTYLLEGDGEMVVDAYACLQELCSAAAVENYPETIATADDIAGGNAAAAAAMVTQAKVFVAPAVQYFRTKFNKQGTPMFEVVKLFKAVRILCPQQARAIGLTEAHVQALRIVPGMSDDALVNRLLEELPAYIFAAEDAVIDDTHRRLRWWRNQVGLQAWKLAARIVFALLPSSAPAERVFSLCEAATSSRQARLLSDQLEASLMLQYNRGHIALL